MIDQQGPHQEIFELAAAIVDRGKGKKVVEICRKHHIHRHFICLGMGTANSEVMDYLGLGEIEKDVVISLAPKVAIAGLFQTLHTEMRLTKPGRGVTFTIPLSGLSVSAFQRIMQKSQSALEKDVKKVETDKNAGSNAEAPRKHDLILTVMNHGYKEEVMAAAREAGATGGTVIHGRNVGMDGMGTFLGISIEPEKDVLLIVARREDKPAIMQAINHVAGANTPCQGFIFSLPVNNIAGLA